VPDGPGGGGGPPFSTALDELQPENNTAATPGATKEKTQVRDMHAALDSILLSGWEKTNGTGAKEHSALALSLKITHKLFFALAQNHNRAQYPRRLLVHLQ
jgi:hypothetical protein